jgi:hypothetical protein
MPNQSMLPAVGQTERRKWAAPRHLRPPQGWPKRKLRFKRKRRKLAFGSSLVQGRKRVFIRLIRPPPGRIPYTVILSA